VRNLDILYEDNSVIIVNKPAGLAVQGGKNVKISLDKILADLRQPAPLLVHRLDKDTSGALLAAKTKEAAARFSRYLGTERKAVKQYIAVCAGSPEKKEGVIEAELEINGVMKKSFTKYKVIKTGELPGIPYSVLEIELGTGRMHQIRRHLALIGCPILGDDKYGNFSLNKKLKKENIKKLMLHASRLIIKEANIDIAAPAQHPFLTL
jgi:23S rRNA pseudouridine955/2504/2580 synthase